MTDIVEFASTVGKIGLLSKTQLMLSLSMDTVTEDSESDNTVLQNLYRSYL